MKATEMVKKMITNKIVTAFLCGVAEAAGKRLINGVNHPVQLQQAEPDVVHEDIRRVTTIRKVEDIYKYELRFFEGDDTICVTANGKSQLSDSLIKRLYALSCGTAVELLRSYGYEVVVH